MRVRSKNFLSEVQVDVVSTDRTGFLGFYSRRLEEYRAYFRFLELNCNQYINFASLCDLT